MILLLYPLSCKGPTFLGKLTDYHGIRACINWREPDNIRILNHYQMTLDSTSPDDTYGYDSHGHLCCVILWGKNPDVLKKTARQLLCGKESLLRGRGNSQPSTALVFSQP